MTDPHKDSRAGGDCGRCNARVSAPPPAVFTAPRPALSVIWSVGAAQGDTGPHTAPHRHTKPGYCRNRPAATVTTARRHHGRCKGHTDPPPAPFAALKASRVHATDTRGKLEHMWASTHRRQQQTVTAAASGDNLFSGTHLVFVFLSVAVGRWPAGRVACSGGITAPRARHISVPRRVSGRGEGWACRIPTRWRRRCELQPDSVVGSRTPGGWQACRSTRGLLCGWGRL